MGEQWLDTRPTTSLFLVPSEVNGYEGDREELLAVKTLLKNATVLNEIAIFCSEDFAGNLEKQEHLYKQLIDFPKGSQNCKINLKLAFLELLFYG